MQEQVFSDEEREQRRLELMDRFSNKVYLPKPTNFDSMNPWMQHVFLAGVSSSDDLNKYRSWRKKPCPRPLDENEPLEKRVNQTMNVIEKLVSIVQSEKLMKQAESDKMRAFLINEADNNMNKKKNGMKHPKKSKNKKRGKVRSTTNPVQTSTTNPDASQKASVNNTPSSCPLTSKDVQEGKPYSSLDGKTFLVEQSNESEEGEEDNQAIDYQDISNQNEAEEPPLFTNAVVGSEYHDLKSLMLLKFDELENKIITLGNKIDNVHNTLEKKIDNVQNTLEKKIDNVQNTLEKRMDIIQNKVDRLVGANYENYIRLNIIRKFDIPFQKFFSPLKLSKIDYGLEFHNAQVELEKRNWNDKVTLFTDLLSSDPPSVQFNFVAEKEDENIIIEATVQNITKEEVWKKKFLQLERQLTFYQHCKKTSVHRAVLISPWDWTEEDFAKCVNKLKTMIPLLAALYSQNKFCYDQMNDYHDI
ncbi:hypothetical protein C9374_011687 [Naegleria lovaniensis]|uniref:Uncharacterized protein n=1 Tax=Naegleria lovaniensis TaxID=51637 RepID=A0AA88G9J8_NAELO|nr:uncharacterized protein C9374_011687 [Naegleria lovaniensis]KAG2373802.1 hypothetical protein C9374_011687 [Naegleria lovaniensis]